MAKSLNNSSFLVALFLSESSAFSSSAISAPTSGITKKFLSSISFVITDYENSIKVEYEGIVPDLFKEDSGVVVLGNLKTMSFKENQFKGISKMLFPLQYWRPSKGKSQTLEKKLSLLKTN